MAQSNSKLILAGLLADGAGGESIADQAILVTGDRIAAVGPRREIRRQAPRDAEQIDLSRACVTPGLIDGHTHLSLAGDGRNYIEMFSETDEMMVLTGAMNLRKHLAAGHHHYPRTRCAKSGRIYNQRRGWVVATFRDRVCL